MAYLTFAGQVTQFTERLNGVQSVHVLKGIVNEDPAFFLFDQDGHPVIASTASSDVYFFAAANEWKVETIH